MNEIDQLAIPPAPTRIPLIHFGLTRHVDRFSHLLELFRAELSTERPEQVSFDEVKAMRSDLHRATCKAMNAIYFVLEDDDPVTAAKRNHILAPMKYQQDRVLAARRRQRVVTDVDPRTGEEVIDLVEDPTDVVEPTVDPVEA